MKKKELKQIEDLLLRASRLAADFPQITEMDLNPVFCYPAGRAPAGKKKSSAAKTSFTRSPIGGRERVQLPAHLLQPGLRPPATTNLHRGSRKLAFLPPAPARR